MRLRASAVLLPIALLVASCGDDASTTATTAVQTTTTTAPAPEATEYTGIARNTTPMDADTAASIDEAFNDVLAENPDDLTGIWIGVWHAENGEHVAAYGSAEKGGARRDHR